MLIREDGTTLGEGKVTAVQDPLANNISTHNILLGGDFVRLIVLHIDSGVEEESLPFGATSDPDCNTMEDAFANGNQVPLRWYIQRLLF